MARGRKKKPVVQRTIKLKQSEVRDFFDEASRLRGQQATYTGQLGETTKTFTERTGVSKITLAFIGRLDRLGDDIKRQSVMDEVVLVFEMMGWNNQGNLFDRVATKKANDAVMDGDGDEADDRDADDEKDLRPPFLQNAMPLDEAAKKFEAAAKANPPASSRKADPTSPLADDKAAVH